jgi:hypothetical protein
MIPGQESTMIGRTWLSGVITLLAAGAGPTPSSERARETVCYVRRAGDRFATECTFVLTRHEKGWTITSRTERGSVQMEVEARYGPEDQLTAARALLTGGGKTATATVVVERGKARVTRPGQEPQDYAVPRGTIVTSAPDWSDVLLLCRRYDRRRQGRQEFPGLWIHPTQAPQRLTFSIERLGSDTIEHAGKKLELDRYLIRIRNQSGYAAWADTRGRLVRLIPLASKDNTSGLTLQGYEQSAAGLRRPP